MAFIYFSIVFDFGMLDRFVSVFHARIVRFSVHSYSIISVGTNE